jgi:hypothetical protein
MGKTRLPFIDWFFFLEVPFEAGLTVVKLALVTTSIKQ